MSEGVNCMDEKKYLNEEKYQKTEKGITVFAILILVVGLFIGGFLIYRGIRWLTEFLCWWLRIIW